MIHFTCKWCGKHYRAPEHRAGRIGHCKKCGRPICAPAKTDDLRFTCPSCGKNYRTSAAYAGLTLPCRSCGQPVTAPSAAEQEGAPPIPELLRGENFSPAGPISSPFELDWPIDPLPEAMPQPLPDLSPFELTAEPKLPAAQPPSAAPAPPAPASIPASDSLPPGLILVPVATPKPAPFAPFQSSRRPIQPPVDFTPGSPQALSSPTKATDPPADAPPPPPILLSNPVPAEASAVLSPEAEPYPELPSTEMVGGALPISAPFPPVNKQSIGRTALENRPSVAPPPSAPVKKQGCSRCGTSAVHTLQSRSPLGIFLMLAGTVGGLIAASMFDRNWLFGLGAGLLFLLAVLGSFLKRWIIVCAGCDRRLD